MDPVNIAVVTNDPYVRERAARVFDEAPPTWRVGLHDAVPEDHSIVVIGPDVDPVPGAIAFDADEPASVLAAIRQSLATRGKVVAVTGASGGVGVTSVALHVAAYAAKTRRVCVVDLDPPGGAAARVGIEADTVPTWESLADAADTMTTAVPVAGGFRILLAPLEPGALTAAEVADRARRDFDVVVLDCPAEPFPDLADRVDTAVMVAAPTRPGMGRARAVLERFADLRWAIVTNRLGPGGDLTRRDLEHKLGRRITLELPTCPGLRDAEDSGALYTAWWSRWPRAVTALADAVLA